MTIETRYKTSDLVWLMHENKVKQMEIVEIVVVIKSKFDDNAVVHKTYMLKDSSYSHKENDLYSTKEELLQSL